jgi:hypothetical protein
MALTVNIPGGIVPRLNPRVLEAHFAQTAANCVLEHGDCRPLKAPSLKSALTATTVSVFKIGSAWKQFASITQAIASPVEADDSRYYYTGATGGGKKVDDDEGPFDLGVSRPSTGPTVSLAGSAGDNVSRSSSYVYTRVTAWGEESAPSQPSGEIDVYDGQHTTFSGLSDGSDSHVTHYRLYRSVSGETSNVWLAVPYQTTAGTPQYDSNNDIIFDVPKASIANMKDGLSDDALNVEMETLTWHAPPSGLTHLTDFSNGLIGGISGSQVCFSVPWVPYAWPTGYQYTLDAPGVGLGHISGVPVAFTAQSVYLFDGGSPDSFQQRRLSETQGCESARSIVNTPAGVFFASKDGLCLATNNGVDVISLGVWTREQWGDLGPEDIIGFYYNGAYFGFFNGTDDGFIFPLTEERKFVTTFTLAGYTIYGGYLDPSNEKLYLILDTGAARGLYEFDAGSALTMTWKSKVFRTTPTNLSAFKLTGETGSSSVQIYGNGSALFAAAQTVTHGTPIRLPGGARYQEYEVQISGTKRWHGWGIGNMRDMAGV